MEGIDEVVLEIKIAWEAVTCGIREFWCRIGGKISRKKLAKRRTTNKGTVIWKLTTETTRGKTMGRYIPRSKDALSIVKEDCRLRHEGELLRLKSKTNSSQNDETTSRSRGRSDTIQRYTSKYRWEWKISQFRWHVEWILKVKSKTCVSIIKYKDYLRYCGIRYCYSMQYN